jgi:integrase
MSPASGRWWRTAPRQSRGIAQTKKFGLRLKPPKTKRGFRTIELDDGSINILLAERRSYQRVHAGIPDGAEVDLSLVRLPAKALMFPGVADAGAEFDFTAPRNPRNFSKEFARRADLLGFGATRFHDLRGIHSTALLDTGIPVHIVAQRIGDDPAVLLRNYVKRKRTKAADASLSSAIAHWQRVFSGPKAGWVQVGSCFRPVLDLLVAKCLIPLQRKGGRVV